MRRFSSESVLAQLKPKTPIGVAQAIEKAQNGNGRLLLRVGLDLRLAPLPLGLGTMSATPRRSYG